jgi:hypothetical protein
VANPERAPDPVAECTLDELDEKFPHGEWVLLRVISLNPDGGVGRGELLHHSRDRGDISRVLKRLDRTAPGTHVCIFHAGKRPKTVEEWREAIANLAEHEAVNARWG